MGLLDKVAKKLNSSSSSSNKPQTQYRPQQQQQQQQGYYSQQPPYHHQQQPYQHQQQGYGQTVAPGTFAPPPGPPPATFAAPPGPPPGHAATRSAGAKEDQFASLARYDTVFLIDDSESMEMFENELQSAMSAVVSKVVAYDDDGVDLYFFNSRVHERSKSAKDVMRILRNVPPRGSTPTASALKRVLDGYLSELRNWQVEGKAVNAPKPRPMNLIVLTDGAPNRGEDPTEILVSTAKTLDEGRWPPYQLGIQFVQIGYDEEAAEHLRKLDDDLKLKYKVRDMIDTTLYDASAPLDQYILKALLGGINRTIDKTN